MRRAKLIGFVLAAGLVLVFASVAAAGPRDDQYGNNVTNPPEQVAVVSGTTGHSQAPTVASVEGTSKGTLPFTGLQLGVIVVGGMGLVGAGAVLRRASRRDRHES